MTRLPQEVLDMVLDYGTFLEFGTLRKVCRRWNQYLLWRHYKKWYTPMHKHLTPMNSLTEPSHPANDLISMHKLLEIGGFGFTLRLQKCTEWGIEDHYFKLDKYLEHALGHSPKYAAVLADEATTNGRSNYNGYEISNILSPTDSLHSTRWAKGLPPNHSDRENSLFGAFLKFKTLPCLDDQLFQPAKQSAQKICISPTSVYLGAVRGNADIEKEINSAVSDTLCKWNKIYGTLRYQWTLRQFFEKLCAFMVKDIFEHFRTTKNLQRVYEEKIASGNSILFVVFKSVSNIEDTPLEVSVRSEFKIY